MGYLTHSKDIVDWWATQGVEATYQYNADGIDYWKVPIEAMDKRLMNPALLSLMRQSIREFPKMMRIRFAPPLWVPELKRVVALCKNKEGHLSVPVSRHLYALQRSFLVNQKGDKPKFRALKRWNQVLNVLRDAQKDNIKYILYFIDLNATQAESHLLDTVLRVLTEEVKFEPDLRIVEPSESSTLGDCGVPEVQVAGGLPADGTGGGTPEYPGGVPGGSPG